MDYPEMRLDRVKVVYLGNDARKQQLEQELDRILAVLKQQDQDIKKIILFGSSIDGRIGKSSDIDLLIVKDTKKRFFDRVDEITASIEPKVAVDILVYTPDELSASLEVNSFIRQVVEKGRVIYEAQT
jgi:predicted nucleotidyltransferase